MEKNLILEALAIGIAVACALVLLTAAFEWDSFTFLFVVIAAFPVCIVSAFVGNYFAGSRTGIWSGAIAGAILAYLLSLFSYYFVLVWLGDAI